MRMNIDLKNRSFESGWMREPSEIANPQLVSSIAGQIKIRYGRWRIVFIFVSYSVLQVRIVFVVYHNILLIYILYYL
jgi:hypothetical protein